MTQYEDKNEQDRLKSEQQTTEVQTTSPAQEPDRQRTGRIRKKRKPVLVVLDMLIVALALTGLALILKPIINHRQQDQVSQELLDNFNHGDGTVTFDPDQLVVDGEDIEYFSDFDEYETAPTTSKPADTNYTTQPGGPTKPSSDLTPTPEPTPTEAPEKIVVRAIARIEIPDINVNMPIAEGTSKYNLRVAIGHYTPSATLGKEGRSVLLGHRMYSYGRHFNRLGEMEIGDVIIIEDKQFRYTYTVDKIDRILPYDLLKEIYAPVEGRRIMLVTCDPIRVASHRLLVRGELTKTEAIP
ncbi:MAG: class D sortase [Bacillota bacterium]|nr:class D sortase [Bacillota bacterium]